MVSAATYQKRSLVIGDSVLSIAEEAPATYDAAALSHVSDVYELAERHNCRRVFIRDGSELSRKAQAAGFWYDREGYRIFAAGQVDTAPSFATIRAKDRREGWVYADLKNRWQFGACQTDSEIMRSAELFDALLGSPLQYSPASSVLSILKASCEASPLRDGWLKPLSRDALKMMPWQECKPYAPMLTNPRPISEPYVHVFDKNAAYLACTTIEIGEGDPQFVSGASYKPRQYAYWRVRVGDTSSYMGFPLLGRAAPGAVVWLAAPQVDLARKLGVPITILEGYIWPRKHTTLKEWGEKLYTVRQFAKQQMRELTDSEYKRVSATIAAQIKAGYTQALGILRHAPDAGTAPKWYHRPDITSHIVSEHYARMYAQLVAWEQTSPGFLGVQTDSVIWTSSEIDPWKALPALANKKGLMGQWHHVATFGGFTARGIREACAGGASAHAIFDMINKAVREGMVLA